MEAIAKTLELAGRAAEQREEITDWYIRNATAKHGTPPAAPKGPSKLEVTVKAESPQQSDKSKQPPDPPKQPPSAAGDNGSKPDDTKRPGTDGGSNPWRTAMLAIALLLGGGAVGGGGVALVNYLFGGDDTDSAIVNGSLLQDLEDRGFHLPQEVK